MSLLAVIGWVVAGAIATGVVSTFWDEIRNWLNSTAADFVEKHLGYGARNRMHRAIATVDKVVNKVRNTSVIYTKRDRLDTYYDKTTMVCEAEAYEIDQKVLNEIKSKGKIMQEFQYKI